ncbi:ankyrin repeat domain-containing protein 34C [Brachyhypopomus gauderio]|uniref:ankyrin repeat domain-containing protein 34C n=1 Tax=Brachyhypopomus gauderio TaxID=698409 RepID=UPI004041BD5A
MAEPQEYLTDGSPLITAARLGKLRLVRLLVEGGAQVNERNQRGETPLLATCRALKGNQSGSTMLRLIRFLLQNRADPNVQDKSGRTALMYACMERAGPDVAAALISAGADPSVEDYGSVSALVYAINAREQDTVQVLLDACRAKGRDIIIIATDLSPDGAPGTHRFLDVPPSPNTSPVSCMSPSDIELKTSSPGFEGENVFDFRATGKRGSLARTATPLPQEAEPSNRQRLRSEPWLAIRNLAHLSRTYEEGVSQGTTVEEEKAGSSCSERPTQGPVTWGSGPRPPAEPIKPNRSGARCRSPAGLPTPAGLDHLHVRRNTLPVLTAEPCFLQLPALSFNLSTSDTHLHGPPSTIILPPVPASKTLQNSSGSVGCLSLAPPAAPREFNAIKKWKAQEQLSLKPQVNVTGFLPPLPINVTINASSGEPSSALRAEDAQRHSPEGAKTKKQPPHHSGQLGQMRTYSTSYRGEAQDT